MSRTYGARPVEEDTAERVDVGAPVERPPLDLLGRRVVRGAEERTGARQALRVAPLGEAEVAEERLLSGLREKHVRRLDVPVDKARRVRRVERAAELPRERQRLSGGQRAALAEQRAQARPRDVAHREVEHAVDLARVVDRDHVRMLERRDELRLAQEPRAELVVVRELGCDDLERDLAREACVRREVDGAHPAAAQ